MSEQGRQVEMRLDGPGDPLVNIHGQGHLTNNGSTFRKVVSEALVDSILLIGPPGSGKSFVLKKIRDFYEPNARVSGPWESVPDLRNTLNHPFAFFERLDDIPDGKSKMLLDFIDGGGVLVATGYSAADIYGPLRERLLVFALRPLNKDAIRGILHEYDSNVSDEVVDIVDRSAAGSGHLAIQVAKIADLKSIESVEMALENVSGGSAAGGPSAHRSEAVSAWIKEMRLGNVDNAMYWCAVLINVYDSSLGYIGRRLAIFAAEDAYGAEAYQTGAALAILCDKGCYEAAFFGTCYMCHAPKWWESEQGTKECFGRGEAEQKAYADRKDGKIKAPSYALDGHTMAGKRMGDRMDDRFSGDWEGRVQTQAIYREHGFLNAKADRPELSDDEWDLFRRAVDSATYLKLRERFGQGGGL